MATEKNKKDTAQSKPLNAKAEKNITIKKPLKEVYAIFHNMEGLPKYIKQLVSVRIINEKRSEWEAKIPPFGSYKFKMEIVNFEQGKSVSWKALTGSGAVATGTFTFKDTGKHSTK